jgi:hypothetical protein
MAAVALQEALSPASVAAKTLQPAADPQKATAAPIVQPIANPRAVRPQFVVSFILSCAMAAHDSSFWML